MIRASAAAGVDAIKLQTVDAARSYAPDTESFNIFNKAALTQPKQPTCFSCLIVVLTFLGSRSTDAQMGR